MKIKTLELRNFMIFDSHSIEWSPNVNIISGGNSTGKTTLLKVLYSLLKPVASKKHTKLTKEQIEDAVIKKMQGVFRPDDMKIGRLVTRQPGNNYKANIEIHMNDNESLISATFSNRQDKHAEINVNFNKNYNGIEPVYIPPKEMISATEHFQSLYEEYHIDFEEMYYDLTKLLDKPLKRGANFAQQNMVLSSFEKILEGRVTQRDKKFYLRLTGGGEFEMGLVSEGYRKLSTIIYLILSGSLTKNSILFWDEPETNMNPMMIKPIAEAVMELAAMGVQVFITTHDYFVQQAFNMFSVYSTAEAYNRFKNIDIKFHSIYKDGNNGINCESAKTVSELEHNPIMQEFDEIYDREQDLIYEISRKSPHFRVRCRDQRCQI